jgi:hypothetical protein
MKLIASLLILAIALTAWGFVETMAAAMDTCEMQHSIETCMTELHP